jgi:PAS domain S-box-containing protein
MKRDTDPIPPGPPERQEGGAELERAPLEALQQRYRELQEAIEGAPTAIWVKDREYRYRFVNRQFAIAVGRDPDTLVGKSDRDVPSISAAGEEHGKLRAADQRVFTEGVSVELEVSVETDHGLRTMLVQKSPLRNAAGEIHAVCGVATDITAVRQAEVARLRRADQHELMSRLAAQALSGMSSSEIDAAVIEAAQVGLHIRRVAVMTCAPDKRLRVCAASDAPGMPAPGSTHDLGPSHMVRIALDDGRLKASIESDDPRSQDLATLLGGSAEACSAAAPIIVDALAAGVLLVAGDTPEGCRVDDLHFIESLAWLLGISRTRERARSIELQLVQAQRLESVGKLAGGIAHEFNNLLSIILNYTGFVSEDWENAPQGVRDDLAEITTAAQRAAGLTRDLLAFGRRGRGAQGRAKLDDVIERATGFLRPLLASNVAFEIELDPGEPEVMMDRDELEQALVALAINASDAMPGGGTLRLTAAIIDVPDRERDTSLPAPGRYARITVTDSGAGMTAEVMERAFDPFYTTKPAGERTGLGLATVHGTVQAAGGSVLLQSAPGEGTSVSIYLPVVDAPRPAPATDRVSATTETATVLVVDDEKAVREVARRLLARAGHHVHVAANAREATDLAHGLKTLDLLVTDLVMPGETGLELAKNLQTRFPKLKVLFISGYADKVLGPPEEFADDVRLLPKPFIAKGFLAAVHTALREEA